MLIRGKPRDLVKECLENYCAEAGYDGAARLFVLTNRGFGSSVTAIRKNPLQLMQWLVHFAAGKCTALKLPLPARNIRVKNNIRVFFDPADPASNSVTAKIAIQSAYRAGTMKQEIEARHRLAGRETDRFAVPRVVRYDAVNYAWLEEEFIEAKAGVAERDLVGMFLRDAASQIYADSRRPQRVSDALPAMGLTAEVLGPLFSELGMASGVLKKRWTASFIHGDLSPANMISGIDNRLYLIDWELSEFAPVAWDLKKVFRLDKKGVLDVLTALRRPGEMASDQQMQIALVCELALLRKNSEIRFSYLTSNRNKSASAARKMMAVHDNELVNSIRELAQT